MKNLETPDLRQEKNPIEAGINYFEEEKSYFAEHLGLTIKEAKNPEKRKQAADENKKRILSLEELKNLLAQEKFFKQIPGRDSTSLSETTPFDSLFEAIKHFKNMQRQYGGDWSRKADALKPVLKRIMADPEFPNFIVSKYQKEVE